MTTETIVTPPAPVPAPAQTFSPEYVHELREEAKGHRKVGDEAKAARVVAEAAAAAAKTEADARVSAAEKSAEQRVIRAELKAAGLKAGIVDLDALKLLDISSITLDADGDVIGADALLAAAKIAKPWMFGAATTSVTAPVPKPGEPAVKQWGEMTKAEQTVALNAIRHK